MIKTISKKQFVKIVLISLAVLSVIAVSLLMAFPYRLNRQSYGAFTEDSANSVILLIGDGMGFNHIEAASYFGQPVMTSIENKSSITTRSTLPIWPTDSAAAATAIATGKKVFNGRIAWSNGKNLKSLGDVAVENGKKLGVITTKPVTDATPAAFTAHNKSRRNQKEIALEQINNHGIDLLIGQGEEYFENYAQLIINDKRDYVTSFEDLLQSQKEKVYAIFDEDIPCEGQFTLAALTSYALDKLQCEDGFFLMVEGAKIDTYSHDNDMDNMLEQFWGFDDAVSAALDYAKDNPHVTVIVTADHETGRLDLPKKMDRDTINDDCFNGGGHTNREVPFFIFGPGAQDVPEKMDNTDIFRLICQLLF